MKWFKTWWLSSEDRQALLKAKENQAKVTQLTAQIARNKVEMEEVRTLRPYRNIYFSNGNLTVVFNDGSMTSKSDVSHDLFAKIRTAFSETEIFKLLAPPAPVQPVEKNVKLETAEERQLVADNLDVLQSHPDFEVLGAQVRLKGVNLAMPASVIASFVEILEKQNAAMEQRAVRDVIDGFDDQYEALKMFWLKLALNTLPQSREDLLNFVHKNDVRITGNGNLILYRRIVSKEGADRELVTFVTNAYYQVKSERRRDTTEFAIGKSSAGEYYLYDLTKDPSKDVADELLINLQQAYNELPQQAGNTFTAWHGKNVEIKLGAIYKIPDDGINLNNGLCAAGGLHAAAVDYDYSGFGDLPVVVLVNPSKAITVPVNETGKLRTTEMFVACVNNKPHGVHFDEGALSAFDTEYHDFTLDELERAAKDKSFKELSVLDTVPAVSLVDLNTIKDMLKKRITTI